MTIMDDDEHHKCKPHFSCLAYAGAAIVMEKDHWYNDEFIHNTKRGILQTFHITGGL